MPSNTEFGLQFVTHTSDQYTVPEIVDLADHANLAGFDQFWLTDMLGYRHLFTTMTAVAQKVPIKIGSGVFVPYYRNPMDVADALVSISELTDGSEVSLGIGRGGVAITGKQVETPRPYKMIAETIQWIEDLQEKEEIQFGDYELSSSYFNMQPDAHLQQYFEPQTPIKTYLGGYGPIAMRTGGRFADGIMIGGEFLPLLKAGRVRDIFSIAEEAARETDSDKELRKVGEVNISIAEDIETAREFTKPYTAHEMMTWKQTAFSDEEFEEMGIDPKNLSRLEEAFDNGATVQEASNLVTNPMIEAAFIVGNPATCKEQLHEILDMPSARELDQVIFAKLGPDNEKSIDLISSEILPNL